MHVLGVQIEDLKSLLQRSNLSQESGVAPNEVDPGISQLVSMHVMHVVSSCAAVLNLEDQPVDEMVKATVNRQVLHVHNLRCNPSASGTLDHERDNRHVVPAGLCVILL